MRRWLARLNLAMQAQRPLRFGRRWRGFETLLRIGQLILLFWLALAGAKLVAQTLLSVAASVRLLF